MEGRLQTKKKIRRKLNGQFRSQANLAAKIKLLSDRKSAVLELVWLAAGFQADGGGAGTV